MEEASSEVVCEAVLGEVTCKGTTAVVP
jgi:hypothetical protein